jgi:uncharacterized membrane protein HdeD (DUF308 family)
MISGILALVYYNLHRHHRYQQLILILGILAGAVLSFYRHRHDTSFNVFTTTMPTSMILALILSNLIHSIAGARLYTEEENMFRALDSLATVFSDLDEENMPLEKEASV